MYLGGFAGFASAYFYETSTPNPVPPSAWSLPCFLHRRRHAGGLIFSFLTITLRANQNVTGLALTIFGQGVANFFGVRILDGATYSAAPVTYSAFSAKLPGVTEHFGFLGGWC